MNSPYTAHPLDALMAAQTAVGMTLGAALWKRPLRPVAASWMVGAAVALCVALPALPEMVVGLGSTWAPARTGQLLKLAAALMALAALLTRRPSLVVFALAAEAGLWWLTGFLVDSDAELTAVHLCAAGVLIGLGWRADLADAPAGNPLPPHEEGFAIDDVVLFGVAMAMAAVVSTVVLGRFTNSGDEWGYTFQAAVLAKGRAYAAAPHCSQAFQAFWVFEYSGRLFAQYTPGWPAFMAPFVWIRAVWLAGPAALGLLVVGAARLGRRGLATGGLTRHPPSHADLRAAGILAGACTMLGSTMLINGGSRFPHVFVAACYAWSVEALCAIADPDLDPRGQARWGTVLGVAAAFMIAARPADGALLGIGLAAFFVVAAARRRIRLRAMACATAAFAVFAGLALVVLRLQLGKWFTTGYSLTQLVHPWVRIAYSIPHPNEFKWGLPLATGSYCWWPCAPAVGLAGLAAMRGPGRRLGFVFFLSVIPFVSYYSMLEMGRGVELGYGPRYALPIVVPMAAGGGALLGAMWAAARRASAQRSALHAGGPAAVCLVAIALGVLRIAPLVYPYNYADVMQHSRFAQAVKASGLHSAVVFAGGGLTNTDPMDLTENMPMDLYGPGDVVVALDRGPEVTTCVRRMFPDRKFYRALPGAEIRFVPF